MFMAILPKMSFQCPQTGLRRRRRVDQDRRGEQRMGARTLLSAIERLAISSLRTPNLKASQRPLVRVFQTCWRTPQRLGQKVIHG
jgi:hypothetical protein